MKFIEEMMTISIKNTTLIPELITDGATTDAFKSIIVSDTAALSTTETVRITLSQSLTNTYGPNFYYSPTTTNLGTLSDPNGGGSFDAATATFTESGVVGGDPTFATQLLNRLQYHAPKLPDGQGFGTQASITVTDGSVFDSQFIKLNVVGATSITGATPLQPIAAGDIIPPFATVFVSSPSVSDSYYTTTYNFQHPNYSDYTSTSNDSYNSKLTGTIFITDGGKLTDADGLLTGAGLSKTGVGTYTLPVDQYQYYYNVSSELRGLKFQTAAVPAGQTTNVNFELDVKDSASGLITKNTTTSLSVIGKFLAPAAPSIADTLAGQTVIAGNVIDPFVSVTVSDSNQSPKDSATITLMDASGKATDANGTLTGTGLMETANGSGVYALAATNPANLTTELDSLTFHPTGAAGSTTSFILSVSDPAFATPVSDSKTTVAVVAPPPSPSPPNTRPIIVTPLPVTDPTAPPPAATSGNFFVQDETTGKSYFTDAESYTGPVAGLTSDIILVTSDNINVTADKPNLFIKTGSGEDAIDVSGVNGNNIMDGYTGSNFLTGGTGNDTFFLDDRDASQPIWSTMVNFHSGDNATIWGITAAGFKLSWVDNEGAATAKGLTGTFTGSGTSTAVVTLAGLTTADLTNGKLTISYGRTGDLPGLVGSNYMSIHGN